MLPKAALQRLQPTTSLHGVFEGLAGPDVEFGNAAIFPALIAPTRFHMILVFVLPTYYRSPIFESLFELFDSPGAHTLDRTA